jgi:pSer/pThr/pTyr-binding forkhead associated (FHA) protein
VLPPAPQANKSSRRDRRAARRGEAVRLVVTEGALAGTIVPMHDGPITIGRAQDSTLVLTDEYVSARHARFLPQGDNWVLEDMGSTNGTYLNRQRLTRPTRVPLSVPIRIGKTVLELRR